MTNFTEFLIKKQTFPFGKRRLKVSYQSRCFNHLPPFQEVRGWGQVPWLYSIQAVGQTVRIMHLSNHDDVIKWKHFPRYWPFVRGIPRSPANSPHKGQSRGALMYSLICAWINGRVNNGQAGDLRRHRAHYDVSVICRSRTYKGSELCRHWACLQMPSGHHSGGHTFLCI